MESDAIAVVPDAGGVKLAVVAPAGAIIDVLEDLTPPDHLVLVGWNGKIAQMFSEDLRKLGRVKAAKSAASHF